MQTTQLKNLESRKQKKTTAKNELWLRILFVALGRTFSPASSGSLC